MSRIVAVVRSLFLALAIGAGSLGAGLQGAAAQPTGTPADIDGVMKALREMPLFRLMLDEVPEADGLMREAIGAEMRAPTRGGPPRTFVVIRQIMRDHMVPGLLRSDDAPILKAIGDQAKIARYLQGNDVAICREFGLSGIQNAARLPAEGRNLLRDATDSLAAAYRSGKQRGDIKPQPPTDEETRTLLQEGGVTGPEMERLAQFATLPEAEACAMTVKIYSAPATMPPARGARLGRIILLWSYN